MPSRRACHQILRNSQTNNGFHKFSKLQIDIVESYATIQTNVATDYNPDWRTTICVPYKPKNIPVIKNNRKHADEGWARVLAQSANNSYPDSPVQLQQIYKRNAKPTAYKPGQKIPPIRHNPNSSL